MEDRTAEQLAADFAALADSIALITDVIAGNCMAEEAAEERQDCVDRNTEHLELMKAKDDWGSEDMTAINSAISAGTTFVK